MSAGTFYTENALSYSTQAHGARIHTQRKVRPSHQYSSFHPVLALSECHAHTNPTPSHRSGRGYTRRPVSPSHRTGLPPPRHDTGSRKPPPAPRSARSPRRRPPRPHYAPPHPATRTPPGYVRPPRPGRSAARSAQLRGRRGRAPEREPPTRRPPRAAARAGASPGTGDGGGGGVAHSLGRRLGPPLRGETAARRRRTGGGWPGREAKGWRRHGSLLTLVRQLIELRHLERAAPLFQRLPGAVHCGGGDGALREAALAGEARHGARARSRNGISLQRGLSCLSAPSAAREAA